MNIIVLSHMYPKTYSPYSGIFVEEQVAAVKESIDMEITVISPVPRSAKMLWFRKKWKDYGQAEKKESGIMLQHISLATL